MLPENAPTPAKAQRGTATDPAAAPANPEIVDVPVETVAVPADPMSSAGPKNTGTFPNLNVKPAAATAQISDEEKAAELEAMRGAGRAAGDAAAPPARTRKSGAAAQARGQACE